ncbi:hypothetical protein [Brevibacillus parabrevis]|uniref:hypothetical protein n=1 Tax=Brevibacillus parabrevis TaxID=54914 RepID=UPI002E22D63A|nr:hypothetical protein [Brevibacillus parabrevis]
MTLKTVFRFFRAASVGIPKSFRRFRLFPHLGLVVVSGGFKDKCQIRKACLGWRFVVCVIGTLAVVIGVSKKHRNMSKSLLENGRFMQPGHEKTCSISALDFPLSNHPKAISNQS